MNVTDREIDRHVLAVMARYPTPGATKTRLAATIGNAAAEQLYRAFLVDLAARLRAVPARVRWFYTPPDSEFPALLPYPACCAPQGEGDLGTRMLDIFAREFAAGAERVVLIGSDAPHLDLTVVQEAFARVTAQRIVLGPALDGGYYLIAMGHPHDVFRGITWSTETVLARSRERAESLGLEVDLLSPSFDIDEAGDLVRLRALLADRPTDFLPATRAALAVVAV